MIKKPLVILTGPTAVGKTHISIGLAQRLKGSIISADSMQVYRHMDIGSNKIRPDEMHGISHDLIDVLDPDKEFNVVLFKQMAEAALKKIYAAEKLPIIVGGTGFYIQALLYDIDFTESEEMPEYREELEYIASEKGNGYLHHMLRQVDPASADAIHFNNVKRVIRALEFYKQNGRPISEHNRAERQKASPYEFKYYVLTDERELLYRKIDKRVDEMLDEGLIEEVKKLKDMGCTSDMVSMQGLGYKEILEYLEDRSTLEDAVYKIKRDTRHFAKRQLTWFRRERDVTWIDKRDFPDEESIIDHLENDIRTII